MRTAPQVGTPEPRGPNRWFVPSGAVGYTVEWLEGRYRCCCPSARWRKKQRCKHVVAVMQWRRKEVQMG